MRILQDLSHLADGSLTLGSMAASNTITEPQPTTAKGSRSEQTDAAPKGQLGLDEQPDIPVGSPKDRQGPGTFTPTPRVWKDTIIDG